MRKKSTVWKVYAISLLSGWMLLSGFAPSGEAALRINMKDGTTLEVPYFWEENGEYRFEIAGGVAGVPKSQVESIHEILASQEFDPAVILDGSQAPAAPGDRDVLRDIVESNFPERSHIQKLSVEESRKILAMVNQGPGGSSSGIESVHSPELKMEGNFADLVRLNENEVLLVLKNVVSTHSSIGNFNIYLALFDGDGKLIQRKSCELLELSLDRQTMSELGTRGRLFTVRSSVKPDPRIKRYEIVASRR